MFGEVCVGISGDRGVERAAREILEGINLDPAKVGIRRDSLGLGEIVYFPNLRVAEG